MQQTQSSRHYIIIVIALLLIWLALLFRFNEPFFGHREGASIWLAAAIRNFNQYGIEAFDYLPVRTPGPTDPETGLYYINHPPLLVWTSTIGVWLFGYDPATGVPHESSIRMIGLLFAMPSLALIYTLAKRLTNSKTALITFLLYTFAPMTIYFGRAPYYDMMVMPLILAFTIVFIDWMRDFNRKRTLILFILAGLIMWMAWVGAFFLATLGLVALIFGDKRHRLWIVLLGVVTGILTLLIPVLYETLRPGAITGLLKVFLFRTSNARSGPESDSFTLIEFVLSFLRDMITVVSLAITILGTVGLVMIIKRYKQFNYAVILALVVAPTLFMLVFRNAFHFHDWYKIHYMPALAITAGIAILTGWRVYPVGLKRYIRPFIFAILICSFGLGIYWSYIMHQFTIDPFGRAIAAQLPEHTEEEDFIMSNIMRPYNEIEYNAYRNIVWGVSQQMLIDWYEEQSNTDAYYLLCDQSPRDEAIFTESSYETLESCRLYHLLK